jgi:hypothetical protein
MDPPDRQPQRAIPTTLMKHVKPRQQTALRTLDEHATLKTRNPSALNARLTAAFFIIL